MRTVSPYRRSGGFNLLEVVIAAFIFSIVAISFLGVWGQQIRALEKSRHVLVATFLAEELIEESMATGYERSKITGPPHGDPPELEPVYMETETRNPHDPDKWDAIKVRYDISREVNQFLDPSKDKLKQVIVRVKWQDTTKTGEVVLETFLAGKL